MNIFGSLIEIKNIIEVIESFFRNFTIGDLILPIGFFFILTSVIGVIRFRHVYNKIHAASVLESLGIPLFIISLIFINQTSYNLFDLAKLCICIFLLYICSAINTSCVSLIKKSEDNKIIL
jgi:monovalent cation/proton antiporter MnhG/PhaG subunit